MPDDAPPDDRPPGDGPPGDRPPEADAPPGVPGRVVVWRICKAAYAATAFNGEGARRYGGRFNSPGVPVVYTAASLALATLELLVRVGRRERMTGYVRRWAAFDAAHVYVPDALPAGWDARPYGRAGQALGDAWAAAGTSLALRVPSVVEPVECNYLLNPRHPAFADVTLGPPAPLRPDPRLFDDG